MHNIKNFQHKDPKVLSFTKKLSMENNVIFIVSVQNSNLYWKLRQSFNKTIIFASLAYKYLTERSPARLRIKNRGNNYFKI
jgi:hypothetical protein